MPSPRPGAPSPGSPGFPVFPFIIGAAAGGVVSAIAGGAFASAVGGVAGALIGGGGAWLLRRPWPPTVRWLAAVAVWAVGFGVLLVASGFLAAVRGLSGGSP